MLCESSFHKEEEGAEQNEGGVKIMKGALV